ncbi:hypothetical protein [Psychrosphaera algicola]|uniref:Uncharacterized protein n=1 Tax=Psychrosphaera algicola TaxID=3023714 RepID=A0ABT5FGJ1_9GAMM|nr:hypothetical protein [Psychrosphaera sp. G1-22]MDC2890334.1 hypothetical protein [Psychrosphaera sp. G1-22]
MKVNNPLLRFYFALAITLLLLIFSVDQIFESAQSDQPPVIDAALVLQNVQQLTAKNRPIRCDAQSKSSCDGALFVEYPAEYWAGALPTNEQPLFELTDSQGKRMLCLTDNSDKLLCINRIDWPASAEFTLDLVYLFYFLLFLILFLFSRSLFNDIEILRNSALDEIKFGKFPSLA